jgi:L-aminopeptidase/D-esterase-like protein
MKTDAGFSGARRPSLTDVDGLLVGHCTLDSRPTGCTVITAAQPFAAGVDVRGGAPGTRETDLLRPENLVDRIHAIYLSGGSAFGLDVGAGVVRFLEKQGRGFRMGDFAVPVVCGAILFDLWVGDGKIRPDARSGYEAAAAADGSPVAEGNVGAGCTVGKLFGFERASQGGLGSWSWRRADGLCVGALAAVNAAGDVLDPAEHRIVAGAPGETVGEELDIMAQLRSGRGPEMPNTGNTVIGVVATNATLDKTGCTRIACMAQDAIARCVYPAHTPLDGETIFAVATGRHRIEADPAEVCLIGAMAAEVLATAILRGCGRSTSDRGC